MQRLTVEAGLKAEQDLLAAVCSGEQRDGLLFWQPTDRALVMPRRMSRLPCFEAACQTVEASGWPVLLRETGGEPVPQSAATLNVALVYVAPRSEGDQNRIESAYQRLCQPLCDVVNAAGGQASLGEVDGAFCDGRFNVNINGRKWVGTAQRWRQGLCGTRPVVLVHGAMLMENERESMVAAVNAFNVACELAQRVRAQSHVAFSELAPTSSLVMDLKRHYQQLLARIREIP